MLRDDQRKSMLGLVVVPAVLGLALLTSGCNTMEGMGEDVQAAGGAMSHSAEDTKEAIQDQMDEDDEAMEKTDEEMMDEGETGDLPQ